MTAVVEYRRTPAVVVETGATYRQLDYWARVGYARPCSDGEGSGFPWLWPVEEVEVVRRIVILLGCGMLLVAAAHLARHEAELRKLHATITDLVGGA